MRGIWATGGLLGMALALIVGEVILTSTSNSASGANQLVSLAQAPAKLADQWMDPSVPLIPARQSAPSTTAASPPPSSSARTTSTAASVLLQTTT